MNKRLLMVGLSGLLGLSLCSGVFGFISNNEAKEANATSSTATYTVKSTTSVTTSGVAPKGSSATFKNTYSTKDQMTAGSSMTLTLSGYKGCTIKAIVLSMHSNKSSGAGTFSTIAGSTTLAAISSATKFNEWYNNNDYSQTYKDIKVEMLNSNYEIKENEDLVITIAATAKSLYCQSFSITYEEDSEPVYATGITVASDLGGKTLYDTSSEVKITPAFDPAGYNGDITYEFTDSSMNDFASIKGNDDLTCTLTPIKAGSVSVIAKASSSETKTISSNVLTFEIVEDTPASIKLTGQNTSFIDGYAFSYGSNAKATITNKSGLTKEIDTSLLTAKLDGKEINESTILTADDNGKEITIEYNGLTFTYEITVASAFKYVQVLDASTLKSGDIIAIVSKGKSLYSNNSLTDDYLGVSDATFGSDGSFMSYSYHFILDKNGSYWNLVTPKGYLSPTAAKKMGIVGSLSSSSNANWEISIDDEGDATIANANSSLGRILHNANAKRFSNYTSGTTASMLLPQIYKLTNYSYTGGIKKFAKSIDELVACDPNGENSDFDLWSDIKTDYYQTLDNIDKTSLKNFVSNPNGDEIEAALSKYDYIVNKYDNLEDYLNRRTDNSSKAQLISKNTNDNSTIVITCLSLLGCFSLVAIGLFAMKRRKQLS